MPCHTPSPRVCGMPPTCTHTCAHVPLLGAGVGDGAEFPWLTVSSRVGASHFLSCLWAADTTFVSMKPQEEGALACLVPSTLGAVRRAPSHCHPDIGALLSLLLTGEDTEQSQSLLPTPLG